MCLLTLKQVATSLACLGTCLHCQEKYPAAEALHMRCLDIRERNLGTLHPDTSTAACNLAAVYTVQGNYEKAELLLEQAVEGRQQAAASSRRGAAASKTDKALLSEAKAALAKCRAAVET